MRLAWIGVLWLGIAGAAHAAGAAVPASGQGCASGWDQLLPAEQRAQIQTEPGRDCQAGKSANAQEHAAPASAQIAALQHSPQAPTTVVQIGPRLFGLPAKRVHARRVSGREITLPPIRAGAMPVALAPLIDSVARAYDIDPLLLHAIARVESRYHLDAMSPAGACGLMQVIAPTARQFGVDDARQLYDPLINLRVSASYLKSMQLRFGNNLPLVLAAYNAGEEAVERYGWRVPPYRETQDYVRKVLAEYTLLLRVSGSLNAAAAERPSTPVPEQWHEYEYGKLL
jgi:lysozyme